MASNPSGPSNCIVTTHSPSGKAVFTNAVPAIPPQTSPNGNVTYVYTTTQFPVSMNADADITAHSAHVAAPPRIVVPGGTTAMVVDLKPGASTAMHRTVSLDYGVVIEGEVELQLDDGEVRRARRGDVVVQRGTMHKWTNVTPDGGWLKIFFVAQASEPVKVGGEVLKEHWGPQPPVRENNL
jgi:quercetin dioxygenase-like cupin family protein